MKNKSRKSAKRQQNSIFWIYGYHATLAALRNPHRRKYELLITSDAQKRISEENDFRVFIPIFLYGSQFSSSSYNSTW